MVGDVTSTPDRIAGDDLEKFWRPDDASLVLAERPPAQPSPGATALAARVDPGGRRAVALGILALCCTPAPDPLRVRYPRELVVAYDDNRATASLTFPSLTYESVIRVDLPIGKHRPLRLRLLAHSTGTVAVTIYENNVLETPGEPIHTLTREVLPDDVSDGKDGRWVVEDLQDLPPVKGTVWIGVRKVGGDPSLWTSAVVSGQSYLRDRDPARALGLLPVKRTPMIRLEMLP